MSKIKRALPEDFDVTELWADPRTMTIGDFPPREEMAVANLFNAISDVEDLTSADLQGYTDQLQAMQERLDEIVREVKKPF